MPISSRVISRREVQAVFKEVNWQAQLKVLGIQWAGYHLHLGGAIAAEV